MNPYDDPKLLAEARWRGGEKHSYAEMAEYLGCSPGVISMRLNHKEHYGIEEFDDYGPEDFVDVGKPTEVDESMVLEEVYSHLENWDAELNDDHIVIDDFSVVIATSEIPDGFDYEYLAVSSHKVDTVVESRDNVGIVSVSRTGIELVYSPYDLSEGADFLIRGEKPGIDYQNPTWIDHKRSQGWKDIDFMRECQLIRAPRT